MRIHNADIATIFEEIADPLEIQGANPFRVCGYWSGVFDELAGSGAESRSPAAFLVGFSAAMIVASTCCRA